MKLAYLLAQYLYANKRLDLPGIGTFFLDPGIIIDTENKQRSEEPEGITFKSDPAVRDVSGLINYISTKTGKMKPLAEADLDSHIQMVQQFLNISKPFSFEGIGTLVKLKPGEYEFTQSNILADKSKNDFENEKQVLSKKESIDAKYQAFLATPVVKSRWKRPVIAFLILCGIGLAILGGYVISSKKAGTNDAALVQENENEFTEAIDTAALNKHIRDSIDNATKLSHYKYVLEIANAKRAFRRFSQLKDNSWDVKMETADSVKYTLFLLLPVTTDTTWKVDSLTALSGKKVYIEHQN